MGCLLHITGFIFSSHCGRCREQWKPRLGFVVSRLLRVAAGCSLCRIILLFIDRCCCLCGPMTNARGCCNACTKTGGIISTIFMSSCDTANDRRDRTCQKFGHIEALFVDIGIFSATAAPVTILSTHDSASHHQCNYRAVFVYVSPIISVIEVTTPVGFDTLLIRDPAVLETSAPVCINNKTNE